MFFDIEEPHSRVVDNFANKANISGMVFNTFHDIFFPIPKTAETLLHPVKA